MPELTASELVRQIHAADGKMVLAITGGGSRAISELLEVPGGSRTLLEAVVPYSAEAQLEFLGGTPEQFCSARTARAMAMAAFQRARRLVGAKPQAFGELKPRDSQDSFVGIGCTASLVSDRPKRGPHRVHVALQTIDVTSTYTLELAKGRRSRAEEETIAARSVLSAVAEAFGVDDQLALPLIETEQVESVRTVAPQNWQDLLLGRINAAQHAPIAGGKLPPEKPVSAPPTKSIPRAVFPGAFNPLHPGHRRMAEIASQRLNAPVQYEISVENVDKLPLDYTEMQQRAVQFTADALPLWFTRAPTFEEKSAIFPGATFIVGADTLVRIGQPCYYHNDPAAAEAAINQIAQRGCRFLVFGRLVAGKFQTPDNLNLPPSLRTLCDAVPADEFRADVTSTELRREAEARRADFVPGRTAETQRRGEK